MRELTLHENIHVSGAKPQFINIASGALFGGIIEGVNVMMAGGPAGFGVGFIYGALEGAATATIYEAENSLAKLDNLHSVLPRFPE